MVAPDLKVEFKEDEKFFYYDLYGGVFFVGMFLAVLFLMATVMIIYYKQMSEGYEDQKRFQILANVGLTKAEANTTVEVTLSSGKGEVSVPSVTGMDETTAYNTLTNSGFTPVKDYAYSADVAQGNVIEQSPNAGSLAKAGDNVKIVISRGKEQAETTSVAVPGVTGLTEDAARSAIQNAGLAVGNVSSAYSDSVASGQIISQSPVADTAVDAGTAVDFVVSMGAEPAQEVKPTTYKINLNIKKPNNESVAAANIYLYDGADGTGNILEQWTNQSISLFGEEGLSISKSGMLASSGSLKIDWLGADGQQLGSSQIVSPISFKAE